MVQRNCFSINYEAPPLVEVAMSVQFDPPKRLSLAHLGAFWDRQKEAFPHVRAVQPIATTSEAFGSQWFPPSLQLALTNEPDCRLQMVSSDDQWMCQVQLNRLVINWRKRSEVYPRFDSTWTRFQSILHAWQEFLSEYKIGPVKSRLWELTYVNRIPKGELWQEPADWPGVFPGLWGGNFATVQDGFLRGFHGQWVWELADPPARLYVEPKPGRTSEEPPQDLFLLSLTARGPIAEEGAEATFDGPSVASLIEAGVEVGHKLIVETFDAIASDAAKKAWGRHENVE